MNLTINLQNTALEKEKNVIKIMWFFFIHVNINIWYKGRQNVTRQHPVFEQ